MFFQAKYKSKIFGQLKDNSCKDQNKDNIKERENERKKRTRVDGSRICPVPRNTME